MASERLARLVPESLSQAQRALYEQIVGGDRAKGVQHFPLAADDGSLNGPFGLMLHAPELGQPLQALGAAIRYRTNLTARIREVAILQVARATGSRFEWWAHERIGRAAGLSDEELMQISLGQFTGQDGEESAAAQLCETLLGPSSLADDEYDCMAEHLQPAQILELTVLVGYYRTLAQMMDVFGVGVPGEPEPSLDGHRHAH